MCCAQGVLDITMAELPTMPFTHHMGGFLHADFSKSARFEQIFLVRAIAEWIEVFHERPIKPSAFSEKKIVEKNESS